MPNFWDLGHHMWWLCQEGAEPGRAATEHLSLPRCLQRQHHSQGRQILLRPERHGALTQGDLPDLPFYTKQKCQLFPCANIPWCPPTGLPLHSSITPGGLLAGQRAACSAADKAFNVSFPFFLMETCCTCKRGENSNILRKLIEKSGE